MPPKGDKGKGAASSGRKRARTAGGWRGAAAASDEQLVRRLTRAALEELVLAALEHGESITREEVEAKAAPEQARFFGGGAAAQRLACLRAPHADDASAFAATPRCRSSRWWRALRRPWAAARRSSPETRPLRRSTPS